MILLIDNYDSFTYNIYQLIGSLGFDVLVKKHDEITLKEIEELKPEKIVAGKGLICYIGRYVRHPSIANSRIVAYNGEAVKFVYKDKQEKEAYKIMLVNDFISALISHIPEKNFKMVRYYGIYSRKKIRRTKERFKQLSLCNNLLLKSTKNNAVYCPCCSGEMEFVAYLKKPPPKDLSKITNWVS